MKKMFIIVLFLFMSISLFGCSSTTNNNNHNTTPVVPTEADLTATLYGDFSHGNPEPNVQQHELAYNEDLTVEVLAEGLTNLTGLDFFFNEVKVEEDSVYIDWASNSTLLANLDDRTQKEDFFFYDFDSIRWFMMDSLWQTITNNLEISSVYYTMDGGKDLILKDLYPVETFPADMIYQGSSFYYNHTGNVGDELELPYIRTVGTWFLDGNSNSNYIIMDGNGGYSSLSPDGTTNSYGTLEYTVTDNKETYIMYNHEGLHDDTFYFEDNSTIYFTSMGAYYKKINTSIPVLMGASMFTGLTPIETDNNYNGGYYYSDLTEDGLTEIINTAYISTYPVVIPEDNSLPPLDEELMRDYIIKNITNLSSVNIRHITIEKIETHDIYSPAFIVSWDSGYGEDARHWTAFFFDTYAHTYIYAYNTKADFASEVKDLWLEEFGNLYFG